MFIDETFTKDKIVLLGEKGSICIINDGVYQIEEVIPFTKFIDENVAQVYIKILVKRIG